MKNFQKRIEELERWLSEAAKRAAEAAYENNRVLRHLSDEELSLVISVQKALEQRPEMTEGDLTESELAALKRARFLIEDEQRQLTV